MAEAHVEQMMAKAQAAASQSTEPYSQVKMDEKMAALMEMISKGGKDDPLAGKMEQITKI